MVGGESRQNQVMVAQELIEKFRGILPPGGLNAMQCACVPVALGSDKPFVLSAPTGAGKTWVLALAALRAIIVHGRRVVYVSPTKALCRQQHADWTKLFSRSQNCDMQTNSATKDFESSIAQIRCFVYTGDEGDLAAALGADILLTTGEKLDVLSRRWQSSPTFFDTLGLLLLDEVHTLSEGRRGATLEAVVTRLRYICYQCAVRSRSSGSRTNVLPVQPLQETNQSPLRVAAASASVPNLDTLGRWLNTPNDAVLRFGEDFRACPLRAFVRGFGYQNQNDFLLDKELDRHVAEILESFSQGKPALVFCGSRKNCKDVAEQLAESGVGELLLQPPPQNAVQRRLTAARQLSDTGLKKCIQRGTAFHHAALPHETLRIIEQLFRQGLLSVLVCTTTLAVGVNLPAQLVVVKNTRAYRGQNRGQEDIPKTTLLQMVGRAGRPGFDTSGTAVIMTRAGDEPKFLDLVGGLEPVKSALEGSMQEVLISEIVIGAVKTPKQARQWLASTFLFADSAGNPARQQRLRDLLDSNIKAMEASGCITISSATGTVSKDASQPDQCVLEPTDLGRLVSHSYLRLPTAMSLKRAADLADEEMAIRFAEHSFQMKNLELPVHLPADHDQSMALALRAIAEAAEFSDFPLRRDQKRWLNDVGWIQGRFKGRKNKDRVATTADKAFQLLQAGLGGVAPPDLNLRKESSTLFAEVPRIAQALVQLTRDHRRSSFAVQAQLLLRCLQLRSWPKDGALLQLEGIGPKNLAKLKELRIEKLDDFLIAAARSKTALATEIGKSRLDRVLTAIKKILACKVILRANFHYLTLGAHHTLDIHLDRPPSTNDRISTGFDVFVVHGQNLIFYKHMKIYERATIELGKESIDPDMVTTHALHPSYHGLDVQYPSFTRPISKAGAKKSRAKPKGKSSTSKQIPQVKVKAVPAPVVNSKRDRQRTLSDVSLGASSAYSTDGDAELLELLPGKNIDLGGGGRGGDNVDIGASSVTDRTPLLPLSFADGLADDTTQSTRLMSAPKLSTESQNSSKVPGRTRKISSYFDKARTLQNSPQGGRFKGPSLASSAPSFSRASVCTSSRIAGKCQTNVKKVETFQQLSTLDQRVASSSHQHPRAKRPLDTTGFKRQPAKSRLIEPQDTRHCDKRQSHPTRDQPPIFKVGNLSQEEHLGTGAAVLKNQNASVLTGQKFTSSANSTDPALPRPPMTFKAVFFD